MAQNFIFTEYNIEHCWYGVKRGKNPEQHKLHALFCGFNGWIRSVKDIEKTRVVAEDTKSYHVYVKDSDFKGSKFVIILWLSNTAIKKSNSVVGLKLSDRPGAGAGIKKTDLGKDFLAGVPVYFYVNTDTGKLFTMRPDGALLTGHPQFDACMRYFMKHHYGLLQKVIIKSKDGSELEVSIDNLDKDGNELEPNFISAMESKKSEQKKILTRAASIRKLVHCITVFNKPLEEKRRVFSFMRDLLDAEISDPEIKDSERIKYEVDISVTKEKLQEILERQNNAPRGERIGFKMKKENSVIWADQCISRKEIALPLMEDKVYSSLELLSVIENLP